MKKFEYYDVTCNPWETSKVANKYGAEGWELIQVIPLARESKYDPKQHLLVFKREILSLNILDEDYRATDSANPDIALS